MLCLQSYRLQQHQQQQQQQQQYLGQPTRHASNAALSQDLLRQLQLGQNRLQAPAPQTYPQLGHPGLNAYAQSPRTAGTYGANDQSHLQVSLYVCHAVDPTASVFCCWLTMQCKLQRMHESAPLACKQFATACTPCPPFRRSLPLQAQARARRCPKPLLHAALVLLTSLLLSSGCKPVRPAASAAIQPQ